MASIAGTSSSPSAVREYSTEGGEVGLTLRFTTPFSSNPRSRIVNTFGDTGGISSRNSLKRLGPARRLQMTFGVQAPPITDMHSVSGQSRGGFGLIFFLIFNAIDGLFQDVSVTVWKRDSIGIKRISRLQKKFLFLASAPDTAAVPQTLNGDGL